MPATTRYNKAIQLLEEGKPVFGTGLIWNGNLDEMTYFADSDYDLVMIEMEHEGLSFNNLRTSLQFLLNRKRVIDGGGLQADPTPIVRIPPNTREQNQWVIKQALDTGVYGLILPHLDTVEGAMSAVRAARYPQVPEYYDAADIWPIDPDGNLLLMGIVEEPTGANNLPDILREVKGIGAIWAGPGDMSVAMGHRGNAGHPEVQEMLLRILGICQNAGVPCAVGCTAAEVPMRLEQGFSILITAPTRTAGGLEEGRRISGR
ncbi:5-keto-4-deoxy-D-glucarate aldolase [Geodia barretti]|uniref:5-keto-4-deoxy-D-glucarate aldolase n=1 Tax=Geodia barretti TaxID=519541 RepID=A0AA35VZT8_GEOBA|nr:5-keto-4-deoxy-D-glucarate aldolase [Geodia barretti]